MSRESPGPGTPREPTRPWVLERMLHRAQPHLSEVRPGRLSQSLIIAGVIVVMLIAFGLLYTWVGRMMDGNGQAAAPTPAPARSATPLAATRAATAPSLALPTAGATGTLPIATPPSFTPTAVPAQAKYRVKAGDTLSAIAATYGVSVQAIKNANGLQSDTIRIGEELVIPAPPSR
ncbi:MAG: LysM peptidoglycan-binding domain-containing protein [Chloroflexi bacterium]|nr:LysM peptidoglycan-binding domain-containing protein [Chloroflexota bacterium]